MIVNQFHLEWSDFEIAEWNQSNILSLEVFLDLNGKVSRNRQFVHVTSWGFIGIGDNKPNPGTIGLKIIGSIESINEGISFVTSESTKHIPGRISKLVIIRIVKCIINSNNLPSLVSQILLSIRYDVADRKIPWGCFNIINGIVVSISVIDTMDKAAQNIAIIVEDQCYLNIVIVLGCDDHGLHVEVRVIFVAN